jgi:Uma2 family endonuclease
MNEVWEESMSTITKQRSLKPRVEPKPAIELPDRSGGETRIAIRGVEWKVYDLLSDAVGEGQHVRMAYDGKDLEIMTTGRIHEYFKDLFGQFVLAVCNELRIPRSPAGETTWKRPELSRGLEADQCYYFLPAKLAADARARAMGSMDVADYPNPDLAIEIDISQPEVDREGIYKSLQVAEIWRFNGDEVTIEQLGEDGTYHVADMSRFLPVKAVEIRRWILEEDSNDQTAWYGRLRTWLRRLSRTRKPRAKRPRRRKGD